MMFRFLSGFRDPVRRPRFIIWAAVGLIVFVLLWAFALVGTSFAWFCETPCHIVHADNTLTYNAGTHSHVSCIACHEPLNANPLTYTYMKIFVLPDLFSTVFHTFRLPMNPYNETAISMPSKQCTQCHNLKNRPVNPVDGLIINHDAHSSRNISCTTCHNRVAHPEENVVYALPGDTKHDNWMTMDACFRCHGQQPGAKAPGTCTTCHTTDFKLVPASHKASGWYALFGESGGHAKAALDESASVAAAITHNEKREAENPGEREPRLAPSSAINSCYTCHASSFCSDCHGGLPMPHPASFKTGHGSLGYSEPRVCARCHARSVAEAKGTGFCNACHHPASTPERPWVSQHSAIVRAKGAQPCFRCHDERGCSYCHVNGTAAGRAQLKSTLR